VTGNDTAHYVLGGKVLSDSEVAKIRQEQKELRRTAYETQPFLSRMFDKESEFSPMVKLAMAMPADKSSAISNVTAKFSNPLKLVSGVFGSLFSTSSVGAQVETKVVDDPFGIDQYGYPDFDPSYLEDPEEYWAKCVAERLTNKWNEEGAGGATFENGWQPVNTKPNRCLLIQAAAGASGAMFTEDVLAPDERSGSSSTGEDNTAPTTEPPVTIGGDIGTNSDNIACASGTRDLGVVTTRYTGSYKTQPGPLIIRLCQIPDIEGQGNNTQGVEINGGAVVNSRVSGAWLALARAARAEGINLYSNSSFRLADSCGGAGDGGACATPGGSPHQMGVAIDFANMDSIDVTRQTCSVRVTYSSPQWRWMYHNADRFGFEQYSAEAWHWDPLPSSNRCGSNEPPGL
jgi:hypothetical protein